ncbi:MAG: glutamate 5-kinase [Crenarchaeota archaeon]|nr:glutamate 5-kinase [Thermoproteota archaeon]MDW8034123.1 glutamate 5-kinase [Nitrososphaerota archaeon]
MTYEKKDVVIKIGTSVLTNSKGWVSPSRVEEIVRQVSENRKKIKSVIIVTSGAIATGLSRLKINATPSSLKLTMKQLCAAVGQPSLMAMYTKYFDRYGINVAQILLTEEDLANQYRYKNFWRTLSALIEHDVIPIINENDAISVKELIPINPYVPDSVRFGDNDRLSAIIASKIKADLLIMLTDVDGFMMPTKNGVKLVRELRGVNKKLLSYVGSPGVLGRGGMLSKLQAAAIASRAGVTTVIANGLKKNIITRILNGENVGTVIKPTHKRFKS